MLALNSKKAKCVYLLWLILIILIREIKLVTMPRFWAEEGALFYAFAYSHSFFENLTTIHVGYYTLLNVLISSFSVLFPLKYAPYFTTFLGLSIQIISVVVIVFCESKWWNTTLKKVLISIVVIIISPPELWINSTNAHFYLGLITLIILLSDSDSLSSFSRQHVLP